MPWLGIEPAMRSILYVAKCSCLLGHPAGAKWSAFQGCAKRREVPHLDKYADLFSFLGIVYYQMTLKILVWKSFLLWLYVAKLGKCVIIHWTKSMHLLMGVVFSVSSNIWMIFLSPTLLHSIRTEMEVSMHKNFHAIYVLIGKHRDCLNVYHEKTIQNTYL